MGMGEFLSTIKNPQIKVSRIIELANDLRTTLEEVENMDIVKQETHFREAELSNRKLLLTIKTLDEEVDMNNQLTKENQSLHKRINLLNDVISENRYTIKKLQIKTHRLEKFRTQTKSKLEKWLKIRLLRKKKNDKI